MTQIVELRDEFRESWYVKDFEKIIMRYLKPNDEVLFVCAGRFRIKSSLIPVDAYYLDILPEVLSDVDKDHKYIIDAFREDLAEKIGRTFDVVVADPPYHVPYHKRFTFLMNLRKLAKRTIIVKWNIIPRFGQEWKLKALYIYEGRRWWTYASIITAFEKA